jgi:hypothetical protein
MVDKYGDTEKALVAYNWGPKNADDWLASGADKSKLPKETQGYITRVFNNLNATPPLNKPAPVTEPTASEKMMVPALQSGMTAKADIKNLARDAGPGYKAAMAMMFLADDKPDDEKTDIWKEAKPAAPDLMAPSALADLNLEYRSPFPEKKPVRMADGGEARKMLDELPNIEDTSGAPFEMIRAGSKMDVEDKQIENMMLGLGTSSSMLGLNLSKMKQGEKENLAQNLMAAYRTKVGDTDVNVMGMRPSGAPAGTYMGNVSAAVPVYGNDRVILGASGMQSPYQSGMTGVNLGYSGQVGPGRLDAMMMQPVNSSQGRSYQVQYRMPIGRAEGSPEMGEMSQRVPMEGENTLAGSSFPATRSQDQLRAYVEALNPRANIVVGDLGGITRGFITARKPDTINLSSRLTPGTREITTLHELEHSMDVKGGDILGRPEIGTMDNNYRAYHLLGKDWSPIRDTVKNMVDNKEKIEKFFGRPIDDAYFRKGSYNNLKKSNDTEALFSEQLATLSALEQATGKFLTQDPEMRQLFPNYQMMAVYDALTGPRQTRMDARDLPPHLPTPSYTYAKNPIERFLIKSMTGENEYGTPRQPIPIKRADGSPMDGEIATGGITDDTRATFARSVSARDALNALKNVGMDVGRGTISNAESLLRGAVSQVPGIVGDLEKGGRQLLNFSFGPGGVKVPESTYAPTSEEIRKVTPRLTAARRESEGMESMGELMAPGLGKAALPVAKVVGKEAGKQILRGMEGEGPLAAVSPPVMYAVKPRGGMFVGQTERQPVMDPFHNVHPPAGMDNVFGITGTGPRPIKEVFTDDVTKYIRGQLGTHNTDLNNWLESKLGRYMRTEMATETDPFVRATDQGKKLHLHQDIDTVEEPYNMLGYVRYQEGLPKEGFAKTPLGKKVEAQIDSSIHPIPLEDLLPENLHPSMRGLMQTDPQKRAYELSTRLSDRMQLDNLTQGMYEMLSDRKLLKYGTEGTPIPEEYILTPEKLKGLSPVQASEKVAAFNKWKEGVIQEQAANYLSKYGPVSKQYDNGRKWVSMDDLAGEPQQQELVKQAGCLGGWCTKDEDAALRYGSGNQRLSILFDEKGLPRAQLTVKNNPASVDDFINHMDNAEYIEFSKSHINPNGDLSYGSVSNSPEFLEWARNQTSQRISEIKAFDNVSNIAETAKSKPYLKEIQDFVRSKNWENVANLFGVDMRDLASVASWPADKVTFARNPEFLNTVKRLNGGSLYVPTDEIDTLLDKAVKETKILPRATGGMVERQPDTARYI